MILLEVYTESGAVYVANVIHQRIRRISPTGEKGDWMDYMRMLGGEVGTPLEIYWAGGHSEPTVTTPVVKLNYPTAE